MSRSPWVIVAGTLVFMALVWWRAHPFTQESGGGQAGTAVSADPQARGEKPETAAVPPQRPEAAATAGPDEKPVVIDDEATMQALFMSLASQLEAPMRMWAESRGMPREDPNGNFMLEQPYQQYDDETLQALAGNGDMWAQQILADRIARLRPAEAMEYYRQAAASGSVYAMVRLADLAGQIAGMSADFTFDDESVALEQYYSLRDAPIAPDMLAYAWNAVAEMAGMPAYLAMMGGRRLAEEDNEAGCALAGSIYADLLEQRAAAGLGAYPSDPPPLWVDTEALRTSYPTCQHEQAVSYDVSACESYVVRNPQSGEEAAFYVCDDS